MVLLPVIRTEKDTSLSARFYIKVGKMKFRQQIKHRLCDGFVVR